MAKVVALAELRRFVLASGMGLAAAAWVAEQQLGLITFRQLETAGISRSSIARLVPRGILHRVHRGVYAFGHANLLPGAAELAAVLACGRDAVAAHRSAAALYALAAPPQEAVHVTVVGRSCRSRTGIRVHNIERLDPRDRGLLRGIPITSPARTLIDFASEATADELERAIGEAYARKLVTEGQIVAAADRAPNHAGVAAVRAELRREGGPQWTQSEGERRMLQLVRTAKLPAPKTQEWIAGWPADFAWLDQKLIVEVDGYQFHRSRVAFERDRRRDQAHSAAGFRVIRVTFRQLDEEPMAVAATIAGALASVQ